MTGPSGEVSVQGTIVPGDDAEVLRSALDAAFDFRGDVTIRRRDDSRVEGFLFDRRNERTLEKSFVRVLPKGEIDRVEVPYTDIAEIRFADRDPAAGKSWEGWVRRYAEKKLAGEEASIQSESLEDSD